MEELLDFNALIHTPAHHLVGQSYQQILARQPAFAEEAYHLARLNRGCSRKLFLLSMLYSVEGQQHHQDKSFRGGRALSYFHRLAQGRPKLAKIMIKTMHYADVLSGRAREFAYQFQAEYQMYMHQEWQLGQAKLRTEAQMLQQDVQRRVDLFLLEAMQTLSGKILTPAEKDAWRRQLEQASRQL